MKQRFVTFLMRGAHNFALGRPIPIGRRGDCAVVGGEPDGHRILSKMFAHELAEIEFTALAHLGRPRVAQV